MGAEPTESLFVAIDPERIWDTRSGVDHRNSVTVKLPVSDDFAGAIDLFYFASEEGLPRTCSSMSSNDAKEKVGHAGPEGPTGAGGSSAYGTALAGRATATTNTGLSTHPGFPLSFNNLTIDSGVTLTVASGSIIGYTGQFTNNGTIVVSPGLPPSSAGALRGFTQTAAASSCPGIAQSGGQLSQVLCPIIEAGGTGDGGSGSPRDGAGGAGTVGNPGVGATGLAFRSQVTDPSSLFEDLGAASRCRAQRS
ncbi:MAG: hypothetical protein ACI8V4_001332 [Ilumatobacter sp.]